MQARAIPAPRDAIARVAVAYAVALAVALATGVACAGAHPLAVALAADLAATLAVFGFSVAYRNSSFYDAYWSVAPLPIALYWALAGEGANGARQVLVLVALAAWGARLTWNWLRGWQGLGHEDWRYVNIRSRTGRAYWPVSLLGIHLAPTLWVFLGCLPVWAAVAVPGRALGWLDALAALLTGGAIWLEARADAELARFRAADPPPGSFLRSGAWAWCRHPNYLGEMGFWWGLWLFGLAASPAHAWTAVGALGIASMFRFVSLPMIETRMRERRPGYAAYAERSSLVLPRRPAVADA